MMANAQNAQDAHTTAAPVDETCTDVARLHAEIAALRSALAEAETLLGKEHIEYNRIDISAQAQADRVINRWYPLTDVLHVLSSVFTGRWQWYRNTRCKYLSLRIDLRDGSVVLFDRTGTPITVAELSRQFTLVN